MSIGSVTFVGSVSSTSEDPLFQQNPLCLESLLSLPIAKV